MPATKPCFSVYPCGHGPTNKAMAMQASWDFAHRRFHRHNVLLYIRIVQVSVDHSQWPKGTNDCHIVAAAVQMVQNQHEVLFGPPFWNRWPNQECKQGNEELPACVHSLHLGQLGRPFANSQVCCQQPYQCFNRYDTILCQSRLPPTHWHQASWDIQERMVSGAARGR